MGATNAVAAFTYWSPHLDDRAMRLLLYMALISNDTVKRGSDQLPRRYYGGRYAMAVAMGFDLPSEDATGYEARKTIETAYRITRRAMHRLTEVGAVKVVRLQSPGVAREYELILESQRTQGRPQ